MENNMFRYLLKYVGKYEVKTHYDIGADGFVDESADDLYIPCSKGKGELRHTYTPGMLMYYLPKKSSAKSILTAIEGKADYEVEYTEDEALIYFKDSDFDIWAKILRPSIKNKTVAPFDMSEYYKVKHTIPKEDKEKINQEIAKINIKSRKEFYNNCLDKFDSKIELEKGKKFNFRNDRDKTQLDKESYIHYIGLWDKFIRFIRKEVKNYG